MGPSIAQTTDSRTDDQRAADQAAAAEIAATWRRVADFIQANPELVAAGNPLEAWSKGPLHFGLTGHLNAPVGENEHARARIETVIAAAGAAGLPVREWSDNNHGGVHVDFGELEIKVYCSRHWLTGDVPPPPPPPPYRPLLTSPAVATGGDQ